MKKKRAAGLLLLLPLCVLSACGGGGPTPLPISANWYANTTTSRIDYSAEKLEYAVTFTPPSVTEDYAVHYNEGTYTTELSHENYTFGDGTTANVLCYKTELAISGNYSYKETQGETFSDFIRSTVYFHTVGENLRPIRSTKEVHSTNPVASPSAENLSGTVHLTYSVEYNTMNSAQEPLRSAAITLQNKIGDDLEPKKSEVTIDYAGSFFDNEQILFALRGLEMNSIVTFATIDPQTGSVTNVTFTETPVSGPFTPDRLTVKDADPVSDPISAFTLRLRYDSSQSGPERKAVYAARTSSDNNTYRNALLRFEDPIPQGMGTLIYSLRNAEFAK